MTAAAAVAAFWPGPRPAASAAIALAAGWAGLLLARDAAAARRGVPRWSLVPVAESSAVVAWAVALSGVLVAPGPARTVLVVSLPAGTGLLAALRLARRGWARRRRAGTRAHRVLVVGLPARIPAVLAGLAHPGSGAAAVGVCLTGAEGETPGDVDGVPVLGRESGVEDAVALVAAELVVLAPGTPPDTVEVVGRQVERTHAGMALALPLVDVGVHRLRRPSGGVVPLARVDLPAFRGHRYVAKRLLDVTGALAALVVLLPVLVAVAVAVKLSSPGPVLYAQRRIGRDGQPFEMLKFRSMVVGAHDRLGEVLAAEGVTDLGLFYKPKNDPRVTRVGRFLRRYSLDELPQLVNVLRGDMSLVGPRPQIEAEVALYDDRARRRLLVRPGCTGLWQVSGRSDLDPGEGVRMDVAYVENWTLLSDLGILARTAHAMVAGRGAY
ncbi:exopolysaccharide biosynthesis polyprenyl glycosylphosphotransferase [Cellulomonas sp. C5510]|uniref:exopolysaccharide biosynthesis polyprenyl glycosylphosphotransferase n=1 Tax=Cellulomonas sp. C5510 TaxID=2871170 RepID=UPI00210500C9|nr:exopolysaccharide biosynthesis polyprenyl glycosylphosphotransferase [Cellulomonas sp. C5510]